MKPLEERIKQIVRELGAENGFPNDRQLKVMLKAEGYQLLDVERWFARVKNIRS